MSSPWSDVQSVWVVLERGRGLVLEVVVEVIGVGVAGRSHKRRPGKKATTTTTKRILLWLLSGRRLNIS